MKIPETVGVIMDGNRRWAKERGLSPIKGHHEGFKRFKDISNWAYDSGVKNLIFYAFSTENWKRSEEEVSGLVDLMAKAFTGLEIIHERKVRVRFIGQRERFSKKLQKLVAKLEEDTKDYDKGSMIIALSYGGRAEIINAVNEIIKEGRQEEVTEEEFEKYLWTAGVPDPDIIIRTGEEMRLSNFLTWQSVYSELYFSATLWPDFDKEEFDYILEEYGNRERRKGA